MWRGGSRFERSSVALERASRAFHGRLNSCALQLDRIYLLAMGRDGVGDEDDGGGRGRVGLEKMLIDDGAEMERRNDLSGHMTRESASAVLAMRPALQSMRLPTSYMERDPGDYREVQNWLKPK